MALQHCTTMEDDASQREPSKQASYQVPRSRRRAAQSADQQTKFSQFPPFGPEHLTNSLHHLVELAAPTSQARTPGG